MTDMKFYGTTLPQAEVEPYIGKLIVVEGTDGVGRSTHIALLRTWLESRGHAVLDTGMTRSVLAGRGIKEAKQGHTLGRLTMQLFYATDFADRLQNEMLPALRAGFIVLTDRYIYSAIARGVMRGADPAWMRSLYDIALVPDAVFYLRVDAADELVPRVLASGRGFDYWESGMDLHPDKDYFDSFNEYQSLLLKEFDRMTHEYGFRVIDATRSIKRVASDLRRVVASVVDGSQAADERAAAVADAAAATATKTARAKVKAADETATAAATKKKARGAEKAVGGGKAEGAEQAAREAEKAEGAGRR